MLLDISWINVMIAGGVSFISPCVLPIVPPFLCYMAGVELEEFRNQDQTSQKKRIMRIVLLKTALLFICGFTCIFASLGATAWTISRFLLQWKSQATFIAGIVILLFGINLLRIIRLSFLWREIRFRPSHNFPIKLLIPFIMGVAFAFSWTPCISPVLSAVLILASSKETASEGIVLLIFYSLGLGVPFLLISLFSSAFMHFLTKFRKYLGKIEKVIGFFLVIIGFLLATTG